MSSVCRGQKVPLLGCIGEVHICFITGIYICVLSWKSVEAILTGMEAMIRHMRMDSFSVLRLSILLVF